MQTFLPYPDFRKSARVLDSRRLGKQRVEAYQILRCLEVPNRWRNHPAVKMWAGYEDALKMYMNACIDEWVARGYRNFMEKMVHSSCPPMPSWLGDCRFHTSHQSNLIRKDPMFYGPKFPGVPDDIPYYWPSRETLPVCKRLCSRKYNCRGFNHTTSLQI